MRMQQETTLYGLHCQRPQGQRRPRLHTPQDQKVLVSMSAQDGNEKLDEAIARAEATLKRHKKRPQ